MADSALLVAGDLDTWMRCDMYIQRHVVSVLRGGYAQVAVQWISSLSGLPQTAFRKSVSEHTVS